MENIKQAIHSQMNEWNIDSLLITTAENIYYLTNFTGSSGAVLFSRTEAKFITDPRYSKEAHEQVKGFDIVLSDPTDSLFDCIIKQVKEMNSRNLGIESSYITYDSFLQLENNLDVELIPTQNIIEKHRKIKSATEIDKIRKAADIGDRVFSKIINEIKPGLTEMEIAVEIEYLLRKEGASSKAFDIIVASGPRSALPHGAPSNRTIKQGDIIMLDFGAVYENYHSDMTRMVSVGEPEPKLKEIHNIVLESLIYCTDSIKAGMKTENVNKIVREFFSKYGYEKYFIHTAGHGIGLMVSEDPLFSRTIQTDQVIENDMVTTIEPGIYLPNIGGVRIEDVVHIQEGKNEVLTKSPKDLLIL